ncbi:MAG: hypothetical protein JRI72_00380 [Deltaproteobacteria bacterium]|nr:hypothetical protein [Deltaproteobacteria bacterium]
MKKVLDMRIWFVIIIAQTSIMRKFGNQMRHIILIILIIIYLTSCAGYPGHHNYRSWTRTEKIMLAGSWVAAGLDYYTSERAFDTPENHELNPVIGDHPTDTELAVALLTSQIVVTIMAHCFPKWRKWLLGGKAAINSACVWNNYNLIKD